MKKSLLAILMIGAAATASAQAFSDYFTVSYHGQVINDGDKIYVTDREDDGEMGVSYESHINVVNKQDVPVACAAVFNYNQPAKSVVEADPATWGYASMCFSGAAQVNGSSSQSCLAPGALNAGQGTVWVPQAGKDTFQWEPHLDLAAADAVSTYTMTIVYMGDDPDALEEGEGMTFYITYCETEPSAVETIAAENAEAKYYDLQGRAVKAPGKGLYIRLANGKAQKVIL